MYSAILYDLDLDMVALVAIVFMVITIVILLSLTIYTVVKSWRRIQTEEAFLDGREALV